MLYDDPLDQWELIINEVNKTDVPLECIKKILLKLTNIDGNTLFVMNVFHCRYQQTNNCTFETKICPRRAGDLEKSVLENPSKFMKKLYSMEELLRI